MMQKMETGMILRRKATALAVAFMVAAVPVTGALGGQGPATSGPLMTEQEREVFLDRLKNAKTAEERQRVEEEHRAFIRQRLLERGSDIPSDDDKGERMHSDATHGSSGSKHN